MRTIRDQNGFTLLELLVVTAIIAALSYLGLTSFVVYKTSAAYSVASATLRHALIGVEASVNEVDTPPPAVSAYQDVPGRLIDAAARAYLPGVQIPKKVQFTVQYDPNCLDETCQSDFIEVKHCDGLEHIQWVRFGDGSEVMLPHLAGGC